MEASSYADTNLLLPHVSVTAFKSDSTSKPAFPVGSVTIDTNVPYSNHVSFMDSFNLRKIIQYGMNLLSHAVA